MRSFCAASLLGLALSAAATAQVGPGFGATRVLDIGAVVQSYTVGESAELRQVSVPISASMRLPSGIGFGLRTVYATVSSDDLESLSSIGDSQLGLSYLRAAGRGIVETSVNLNLPTGKGTLDEAAFSTASTVAYDDFGFMTPTLGQGASISPSLSVAFPAGPEAALGFGVSYALKSAYEPFEADTSAYAPGNELALTVGIDTRSGSNSVSFDITAVRYGQDEFRGNAFQPGSKISATARWKLGTGRLRGRAIARYRHVLDGALGDDDRPVVYLRPSHAILGIGILYDGPSAGIDVSATSRYYGSLKDLNVESAFGDQQILLDLAVAPSFALAPTTRAYGSFTYTMGLAQLVEQANAPTFGGFRAGLGIAMSF